ncbi:flagellar basal body-associated FliL family protein [Thiomicrorhabdus sp. ZW0627]|uniref:flagellar basal body-associated FliL family protein n=1 Tax=Thiomicrorhabdus sp. ZW0627 TaxID=3039774 RepID=UPI002437380B|nr:flagellar basal body-associated FliL family protein [Thiomicrorhabdus sp. ZW0627]MDG6773337.1 flagellar basal body-associated FliL family protein [Thiomicrorhabdus sp. ZW0627]
MAEEEVKKEKSGKGLIIVLLVILILLVIGIGVLAFLLLSGGDKSNGNHVAETEMHADANYGDEGAASAENMGHVKTYSPKYKQLEPPEPNTPPMYFTMDKFVVNFNGDGQAKYLAVDLKFMSYYAGLVGENGEMEHLRPILKNDIQRLLRNQHYNDLNTPDGPDKLRAEILATAKKILEKHNIYPDLLEDVYMTRFVMQ